MHSPIGLPADADFPLSLLSKGKGVGYLGSRIPSEKAHASHLRVDCLQEFFGTYQRSSFCKECMKMPVLAEKTIKGTPCVENSEVLVSEVVLFGTERSGYAIRRKVIIVPFEDSFVCRSCPAFPLLKESTKAYALSPTGMDTDSACRGFLGNGVRETKRLTGFSVDSFDSRKGLRKILCNAPPAKAQNASNEKRSFSTEFAMPLVRFFHTLSQGCYSPRSSQTPTSSPRHSSLAAASSS